MKSPEDCTNPAKDGSKSIRSRLANRTTTVQMDSKTMERSVRKGGDRSNRGHPTQIIAKSYLLYFVLPELSVRRCLCAFRTDATCNFGAKLARIGSGEMASVCNGPAISSFGKFVRYPCASPTCPHQEYGVNLEKPGVTIPAPISPSPRESIISSMREGDGESDYHSDRINTT